MRRSILTGPIVLMALTAGYAALGSGLDRLSRDNPASARMVPIAFRANAWRGASAQDMTLERYTAALDKARRAIVADPIDVGSSSGMGLARLKLRQGVAAEAAFRVAGQLGWRDKNTQLYWMAVSADSGAFGIAAERADALLRQDRRLRELPAMVAGLEATEGGRKAYDSALALAVPENVTADDTGFLRLSDLLAQWGGKLNGTELVVLSACRTARGEMESGDGFVALTWGFLFAGSKGVIASLWEVDDTATALLMSRLYENLLGSFDQPREIAGKSYPSGSPLPRALALSEAKTWLRDLTRKQAEQSVKRLLKSDAQLPRGDRPYSDPYFWGAFLLFGGEDS